MTYAAFNSGDFTSNRDINLLRDDFDDFVPLNLRRRRVPKAATLCGAALTLSASLTLLAMHGLQDRQDRQLPTLHPMTAAAPAAAAAPRAVRQAALRSAAMAPLRNHVALFDPTPLETRGLDHPAPVGLADAFAASPIMPPPEEAERRAAAAERVAALPPAPVALPVPAAQTASLQSDLDGPEPAVALPAIPAVPGLSMPGLSEAIPLPAPRPIFRPAAPRAPRIAEAVPAAPGTAPAKPGFFEQVFGGLAAPAPAGQALAYANPEDGGSLGGLLGRSLGSRGGPDNLTAVYDIAAHTVTLPDGTRLEAHSGLGAMRDNPYSVTERMRGATPPNVYELTPREAVFHGVRALRLTPTGGTTFGRGGLLAHTFMLGPNGDSNGCVVFRNYKAFLDAYDSGRIRRLAVVARAG